MVCGQVRFTCTGHDIAIPKNKAGYTATPVASGWAGAIFEVAYRTSWPATKNGVQISVKQGFRRERENEKTVRAVE